MPLKAPLFAAPGHPPGAAFSVDALMLMLLSTSLLRTSVFRKVTDRTIAAEISRGACTVDEIAACTGAGTKCGRCRPEVAEMILGAEVPITRRVSLPTLRESPAARESADDVEEETRAA
ncbi:MAG: (2Fe-2S)-binding protein [Polyangiaceae bacterium]